MKFDDNYLPACDRRNLHLVATWIQFKEKVWLHTETHWRNYSIKIDDNWSKYTALKWYSCPVLHTSLSLSCLWNFIALLIICRLAFDAVTSEIIFDFFSFTRTQIERLEDGLNVLHALNVDHNLSGEVKCHVISRNNPKIFNVYHTTLTVLPVPISERYEPIESVLENSHKCSDSKASSVVHDLTCFITQRPEDKTVLVGASIELNVSYIGYPEPTVRWMRAVSN